MDVWELSSFWRPQLMLLCHSGKWPWWPNVCISVEYVLRRGFAGAQVCVLLALARVARRAAEWFVVCTLGAESDSWSSSASLPALGSALAFKLKPFVVSRRGCNLHFPVIMGAKPLFMWLTIGILLCKKYLCVSFAHFLFGLSAFFLMILEITYVFWVPVLCGVYVGQTIFSCSLGWLFTLLQGLWVNQSS